MSTRTEARDEAFAPHGLRAMSCATLAGGLVVNRARDELGSLRHVMIDVVTGRIAYALLASGGVFGIGERLFVIPWTALSVDIEGQRLVLDVDKEHLERAFAEQR
jgi:hypothetical protein